MGKHLQGTPLYLCPQSLWRLGFRILSYRPTKMPEGPSLTPKWCHITTGLSLLPCPALGVTLIVVAEAHPPNTGQVTAGYSWCSHLSWAQKPHSSKPHTWLHDRQGPTFLPCPSLSLKVNHHGVGEGLGKCYPPNTVQGIANQCPLFCSPQGLRAPFLPSLPSNAQLYDNWAGTTLLPWPDKCLHAALDPCWVWPNT